MEASRFLPEIEPVPSNIVCRQEYFDGQDQPIYHFWKDGQKALLTMKRAPFDENQRVCTYEFVFSGWPFAHADVHVGKNEASIDYQGPLDRLSGQERLEADRLLPGSIEYLKAAVLSDFPNAESFSDDYGQVV